MNFNSKIIIPAVLVVIILSAGGGYFYWLSKGALLPFQNQNNEPDEVKRLVAEVGRLIDLPTLESPTIATVTDVSKLKEQPFFQKAKNGDKVLIYTQAKKAYLYDPKIKKVMDVAPINIGTESAQVTQPKIVLRNGTTSVGLTLKVEAELKKTYLNLNVSEKENAVRADYQKTMVVILQDNGRDLANNLAKTLQAEIGDLPPEESKPKDGDILIILGKDSTD